MLEVNFNPFPVLETPQLILRKPGPADAQGIFELRSNPEIMRFVPRPLAENLDQAKAHLSLVIEKIENNTGINWVAKSKSGDFVGLMGLFRIEPENYRAEIGYMILPQFHGKGLMSEAVSAMVGYGFGTLKLHSIEAIIDPENYASGRVLEKNGFVREAHIRENLLFNGAFLDTVIYSLLNPDDRNIYQ